MKRNAPRNYQVWNEMNEERANELKYCKRPGLERNVHNVGKRIYY